MFIGLLTDLVNGYNRTNCALMSNQKYMTRISLINLYPNEYNQELHLYPFVVKLDRCAGSCNTLNELSNKYVFQTKQKI